MLPCPKAVQYGRDTHQATTSASPLTKSYTRLTTPAEAAHETLGLVQDLEQEILPLAAPPGAEPAHGSRDGRSAPWADPWPEQGNMAICGERMQLRAPRSPLENPFDWPRKSNGIVCT